MSYDLIIRGGRVVDGSGLPSYVADVGIKDGKIAEVGRLKDSAARVIDAAGLVQYRHVGAMTPEVWEREFLSRLPQKGLP